MYARRNFKSIICSFILLFTVLMMIFLMVKEDRKDTRMILFKDNKTPTAYLSVTKDGIQVNATYNGAGVYLYLPAFFENETTLYIDKDIEKISMNGEVLGESWNFAYDVNYWCQLTYNGETTEFPFCVTKSDNMNTMFISTESGNMEYVNLEKGNRESGKITIYDTSGYPKYNGSMEYIEGRGNTSWLAEKKSYNFKVSNKVPILGMDEAVNWTLLAGYADASRIGNVMAQDMAKAFGLEVVFQCEWVDLYLNGDYVGNYVVCEDMDLWQVDSKGQDLQGITKALNTLGDEVKTVSVGTSKGIDVEINPGNISGTYIIELDTRRYYDKEISGFCTMDENYFTIKTPKYSSLEQVQYIEGVVQKIEDMLRNGDDRAFEYLDIKSFAIQYFVETFMGDCDMSITSTFFYKKYNDDVLYAGPVWDFDKVFGMYEFMVQDYDTEALELHDGLTWYQYLAENDEFQEYCAIFYEKTVRPYVLYLIESGVDAYANEIKGSYEMDGVCCGTDEKYYKTLDTNVRYIKFYLAKRIELMDEKYGVTGRNVNFHGDDSTHIVTVMYDGEENEFTVYDGECFTELWELDPERYYWWIEKESGYMFNERLPILEDMVISALEK